MGNDTIYMLHKKSNQDQQFEFKEEQRDFLCSNKGPDRCSSLDFNNLDDPIDASLDYLARILVQAYVESKKIEHTNSSK
jgi:hypothetical protein